MKSITHPEGYIEKEGDGSYKYVYQLKDIWGNTRITFADDNDNGSVNNSEIRREQNYYPFGMPHKGYNDASYGVKNNLKTFQGQELTEDLGLNTHEWRYRMSDRSIGRFWQIDPLAEDYVYNSTHAFQENKMGMGVELEGLEYAGFQLATYAAQKTTEFENNVSEARNKLGGAVENRVEVLKTGEEKNDVQVANYNINQVQDAMAISESLDKIGSEAVNTAKEVTRDGADKMEETGDLMVITAPATGPAAPVVSSVGSILSTAGTVTNIALDMSEGNFRDAWKRTVLEAMSGGLSTVAKKIPGVEELGEQVVDSQITLLTDIIDTKIE